MNNNPPIIDTGDTSTPPAFAPDAQPQQFVAPEPEKKKGSVGTIIFAILFVIALAGAGFMFYMNMEANKQVDDLTKKNKDLTAQLAEKPEEKEEEVKGDITGDFLLSLNKEFGEQYSYKVNTYGLGVDDASKIIKIDITDNTNPTGGYLRFYYLAADSAEWKLVAEGNGIGECLFYDEGVAAAFGESLPCTAPAADDQTDPAGEPTGNTPTEEE